MLFFTKLWFAAGVCSQFVFRTVNKLAWKKILYKPKYISQINPMALGVLKMFWTHRSQILNVYLNWFKRSKQLLKDSENRECVCVCLGVCGGPAHLQFPLNITLILVLNLLNQPANIINNFIIYVFTKWNNEEFSSYFSYSTSRASLLVYQEKLSGEWVLDALPHGCISSLLLSSGSCPSLDYCNYHATCTCSCVCFSTSQWVQESSDYGFLVFFVLISVSNHFSSRRDQLILFYSVDGYFPIWQSWLANLYSV